MPAQPALQLQEVQADATGLTLVVATTVPQTTCPLCGVATTRRHSGYQRTLADAPWATVAVRLRWHTRRFWLENRMGI